MASLDGSRAKRDRAHHHLEAIEQRIGEFLSSNPYPIAIEAHPKEGQYVMRLREPKPFPVHELAVMIGDCVHNMRAALDFITWELAGARPSDRRTMFPIFETPEQFRKNGTWRIKDIPDEARALIESVQPYHAQKPRLTSLYAIDHFDAADKHRLLTVALFPHVSLVHDAVIAVFTIAPPVPDMNVQINFSPQIAFGEGIALAPKMFVIPNLKAMLQEVDIIIHR